MLRSDVLAAFMKQNKINIKDWVKTLFTLTAGPAKTLPPRGAGWEPERLAFQS